MASCPPGSRLILSRATHLSTFGALVLAGAEPLYAGTGWNAAWQLPAPPTAADVAALSRHAAAALVTRPDYFGHATPMTALARACRKTNLLLLVDEAHGAHLGLDPRLPSPALAEGADAVVQSTHKLASALTQASMLHLQGGRMNPVRLRKALRLLQTSSPSYLLMASLDAARAQRPALCGAWATVLDASHEMRSRLAHLGLPCLGATHGPPGDWDPAKLVLDLEGSGHSGLSLAMRLHDEHHVQVELATPRYLGLILSPAHTPEHLRRFEEALLKALRGSRETPFVWPELPAPPPQAMPARDAFLGTSRSVPFEQASGMVAAEFVCPYPPGLPALIPGERIERETIAYLHALRRLGASFVGPEAPDLETIQVCEPIPS